VARDDYDEEEEYDEEDEHDQLAEDYDDERHDEDHDEDVLDAQPANRGPRGPGIVDRIKALFDAKEPPSSDVALWEFDKVLTSLNDAFVSWRYAHEYGMKQTTFDTRLAISIQEAVLEHMPAWRHLIQFRTISASSTQ
jgi:hypothetical protein